MLVMLGSNCTHGGSTGTTLVFRAVVIQRSGKRKKEQWMRIECQSSSATAVLYSTNPVFAEKVKPLIFLYLFLSFQIKTGNTEFLKSIKQKCATRDGSCK